MLATPLIFCVAIGRKTGDRVRAHGPARRKVARGRAAFTRAVWADAARHAGAALTESGGGLLEIRSGRSKLQVRGSWTSLDDAATLDKAGDKSLVCQALEAAGVPVPRHAQCRASDVAAAGAFLATAAAPCVIKPARGTAGGAGVTSGVAGRADLLRALGRAAAYCPDVVLEEQLFGGDYRLLYLDGRLLDAVRRDPPTVIGDGRSTVRRLIAKENRRRRAAGIQESQALLHVDLDVQRTLARADSSLSSVPPAGAVVAVKAVVSENRGEDNVSAAGAVCAAVVETGARAAAAVGARFAGVDLITHDPGVPLDQSGGAVIEVNTTPSLYYHYAKRPGPTPVARSVLQALAGDDG